jgi:DNA-binding NarL/FixJ family response regulator
MRPVTRSTMSIKSATSKAARIVIVDDHPLVREGIALRLGLIPDFEIVGQAESEDEAVALIKSTQPDVATVDISLKTGDGLSLLRQIKHFSPHTKTLVVTSFQESVYGERCLRAGALGFLNKQESSQHLIDAVQSVSSGERYLSPWLTQRLISMSLSGAGQVADPLERLSSRELEILRLIGEGLTSGRIADQLIISPHTVDTHRENLKRKLGLSTAAELTRYAVQWLMEQK